MADSSSVAPPADLTNSLVINKNDDAATKAEKLRLQSTVDSLYTGALTDQMSIYIKAPGAIGA